MAKKTAATTATALLTAILTSAVETMGEAEVQAVIESLTAGKSGKKSGGKADKKADKKGGKKKMTAEDVLAAIEEGEEVDLSSLSEDVLREVCISLKLTTKGKAKGLDQDDLVELLEEHLEEESDEDEDEDEDGVSLDDLDEDGLRDLAIAEKLVTKAKAKRLDEDELRALLEEHFSDEDEDEDDYEEDEDEDEDE